MADQDLPKFLFDLPGWRGSRSTQRMSMSERGVYLEMLLEQWEKRNLPDSAEAVADLIASTEAQVAEVLAAWPVVRRKFVTSRGDGTRIYNAKLERTRREQRDRRRVKQSNGAEGGKAKAANRRKHRELEASKNVAVLGHAVAKPSEEEKEEEVKEVEVIRSEEGRGIPPPRQPIPIDARSKRPVFIGQRLTVFEWMFDDCLKALGEHFVAFGLDDWFQVIDDRAVREGLVIPKRDGGEWLQAELVAECQRRGLPIRFASTQNQTLGKQTTRLAAAISNIRAAEGGGR
ncbi:MAG TPA: hypothetical protein VF491_17685 [Vicinamibacterales bacterium]